MKWIGLTGGIATGKSTVSQILKQQGYPIVDADQIAREVVAPKTVGLAQIQKVFGYEVMTDSGELNRKKLGQIVFDDIEKRLKLEKIIHPLVQERVKEIRNDLASRGHKLAFYDVPLLFEKGLQAQFDLTVCVACSDETQLKRLMSRDQLDSKAALARIKSQMSLSQKISLSDHVIWNDGNLIDLEYQVNDALIKIKHHLGIQ